MRVEKLTQKWFDEVFEEMERCQKMTSEQLMAEIDSTRFAKDEGLHELLHRGLRETLLEHYKDDDGFCKHIIEMDDLQKSIKKTLDAVKKRNWSGPEKSAATLGNAEKGLRTRRAKSDFTNRRD